MKLKHLVFSLVALLALSAASRADLASLFTNISQPPISGDARRTSIIIIQCHDLALGDLSCYGQTNYATPNLDRLAAGGIRFTDYSGAGDSAQMIASLLAGKNSAPLAGAANLAQRLQVAGYRTGLIGEWSQAGQPWKLGFDDFAGFLEDAEGRNYYADYVWRYAPRSIFKDGSTKPEAFEGKEMIYPNTGGKQKQFLPDTFVTAMINFVRVNQPDAANHYRPFFLLANLSAPRSAAAGADDFPVPSDAPFTGENWPQAAKNRAALISRLDTGIGRLLEQINKQAGSNNVAIFFTSSSAPEPFAGPNMNFLLPKQDFRSAQNPELPKLPMIVYWPGTINPGRTSGKAWSVTDLAPTALAIARQNVAADFAGQSVLPVLLERQPGKPAAKNP